MPLTATDAEALAVLRRQYFQLLDPALLRWPDARVLKQADAQSWLFERMFESEAMQHCPPTRYQLRILKQLVARIEGAIDPEDEICDKLMTSLSTLLSSALPSEASAAQTKSYVSYEFGHERSVTVLETRNVLASGGTTGLRTWDAALHLGAYLASPKGRARVRGKRILELGAGTGLLSILSTKHLQAARATATDGDEGVVDAIKTNVLLNSDAATAETDAVVLRWGRGLAGTRYDDADACDAGGNDQYDVVLGADVTYDRRATPWLVSTLSDLLERQPSLEVLIAASIRNEQTFEAFDMACSQHDLHLASIAFAAAPVARQTGPFYPTTTPLRIVQLARSNGAD